MSVREGGREGGRGLCCLFSVGRGGGGWLGRGAVLLWGLASERWSRESASEHLARARPQKRPGRNGDDNFTGDGRREVEMWGWLGTGRNGIKFSRAQCFAIEKAHRTVFDNQDWLKLKPSRSQQSIQMARSANQHQVILPLGQSGGSNFCICQRRVRTKWLKSTWGLIKIASIN